MSDTFDYVAALATADRLLAKFGIASAVRRTVNSGAVYAPTQTVTDYATLAAVVNMTRWYAAMLDGSDILRTDRLGLVSAGPLNVLGVTELSPFDSFVHDTAGLNRVYKVMDVKPIRPAATTVFFILQLRI